MQPHVQERYRPCRHLELEPLFSVSHLPPPRATSCEALFIQLYGVGICLACQATSVRVLISICDHRTAKKGNYNSFIYCVEYSRLCRNILAGQRIHFLCESRWISREFPVSGKANSSHSPVIHDHVMLQFQRNQRISRRFCFVSVSDAGLAMPVELPRQLGMVNQNDRDTVATRATKACYRMPDICFGFLRKFSRDVLRSRGFCIPSSPPALCSLQHDSMHLV